MNFHLLHLFCQTCYFGLIKLRPNFQSIDIGPFYLFSYPRKFLRSIAAGAAPPLSFETPMVGILHAIPRFLRPPTTISPPPKLSFLTHCRRRVLVALYLALPSPEKEEIRSPQLVAREYADLNLTDKFCQVGQLVFYPF